MGRSEDISMGSAVPARTTAQITTTQSLEAPPGILDRGSASKSLKLAYIRLRCIRVIIPGTVMAEWLGGIKFSPWPGTYYLFKFMLTYEMETGQEYQCRCMGKWRVLLVTSNLRIA